MGNVVNEMKLKVDFYGDWINALRDVLTNDWGCDISAVSDDKIPYLYFNTENRRPPQKKREVILADTFVCPKYLEAAFKRLVNRVENGEDLTGNLSKLVSRADKKDLMLNDWHVHHFHLNENADGSFAHGSEFLVFAWLANNKFHVIGIFPHNDWLNQTVIETMHRNWPLDLNRYKLIHDKEISAYKNKNNIIICDDVDLSRVSKEILHDKREKGVFTPVVTDDGTIYIFSYSVFDVYCFTINQKDVLERLEKELADMFECVKPDFEDRGYDGLSNIEAYLEVTDTHYVAVFPVYKIGILLKSKFEYIISGFEKRCYQISKDTLRKNL